MLLVSPRFYPNFYVRTHISYTAVQPVSRVRPKVLLFLLVSTPSSVELHHLSARRMTRPVICRKF